MKKLLLLILFIVAALYLASNWYTIKSSRSKDGTYKVIVVNTTSGKIYKVMGD